MPIKFSYESPNTGAQSEFHVVNVVQLSKDSAITFATVASFVSESARAAGKHATYQQQIQLDGLPVGESFAWAEAQLVQAKPTDGSAVPRPIRYVFAGGEVVSEPAQAS